MPVKALGAKSCHALSRPYPCGAPLIREPVCRLTQIPSESFRVHQIQLSRVRGLDLPGRAVQLHW